MPRLTRLYTRKGDDGSTALSTGRRVPKDSARVEAYGAVDEVNAQLGVARATGVCPRLETELAAIQNRLFDLGADLATPASDEPEFEVPRIRAEHVAQLEALIDELNEEVGPLENFILPGGGAGAAALHLGRTVCRRAERRLITLARHGDVGEQVIAYVNRLSDALFVMARFQNLAAGCAEPLWRPGE
jgi:cob(I)alamin adenosyltransferase